MEMKLSQGLFEALEARGLDVELCAQMGLHASPDGGGDVLKIPFFRDGVAVQNKYRTLTGDKKFWQDGGGIKCFWNEDCLRDDTLLKQALVITEGEMDALAVIQSGHLRTVSVPDGAPKESISDPNTIKYSYLEGVVRPLLVKDRVPEIILAVDGDEPGANLLRDLSVRLGRARCKFVTYPKHPQNRNVRLKDLNDVLLHYGPKGVQETLARAQWLRVDGVYRMSELPPVPPSTIYEVHMDKFSAHYKVRLGDMAVWTGIPSHGKSSLVNDICCRLAYHHDIGIAFASFEQAPQRDHRRNLRTWFLGKPTNHAEEGELRKADAWIDKHFAFMVPSEDDDVSLDWVLDRMEAAVVQFNCKVIVIDPWNEMDHARAPGESLTEYTGRAIKALKRFAKAFDVHLIIVAHPAKQQKDEKGEYRVPTLYDISDSAHWYNKADLGVVVHRLTDHSVIRVAKSRYHDEIGIPGEVNATFKFEERRFECW